MIAYLWVNNWTLSLNPTHPGSLRLWPPPSCAMSRSLEMSQSHKNLSPTTSLTSEWTRNTSGGQEILTSNIYDCLDWTVNIATSWTTKQFIFMSSQPWIKVFRTADDPILYIGIISIGLGISSRVSCLWSSLFFSMSISFAGLGEFFILVLVQLLLSTQSNNPCCCVANQRGDGWKPQ